METKVCGGTGYVVGDFRTSWDTWIAVPVRWECNTNVGMEVFEVHDCGCSEY